VQTGFLILVYYHKAFGSDCLLNEYFIECSNILASYLCDIFNGIFNSGFCPESWMEGIIVPLHKKDDVDDVNNYGGITLVNCMSKLFTTVLDRRIESFYTDNNIIIIGRSIRFSQRALCC